VAACTSKISLALNTLFEAYLQDPEKGLEPLLRKVRSVAHRTMHDDDRSQDFTIMVWQALPDLKDLPCSFGGWIYRRLQWRQVDFIRADQPLLKHEEQVPEMAGDDGETLGYEDCLDILTYRGMKDATVELDTKLERINDPFVRRVAGYLVAGYTQAEIAKKMSIKPATLRKRLERYRQASDPWEEELAA
jgi:DNA-directed RNA polymerase specialized sigma24 family protein